jgi:hypothetical protein
MTEYVFLDCRDLPDPAAELIEDTVVKLYEELEKTPPKLANIVLIGLMSRFLYEYSLPNWLQDNMEVTYESIKRTVKGYVENE